MIAIKIAVMLASGCLMAWGGYNFKVARRFILPAILCVALALICHSWWALLGLSSMAALSIGYGDNAIFSHIFGHSWGRSVYGLLVAICLSLPLFLTHHLVIWFFVPYLIVNFTLENALKNVNQIVGDLIIGAGFGAIVFLIHV